ncbi:BT0820 family HAD-type phosphatase [Draconibacterium orientale]|uniref:BT0820 family HAD-type phosphatase n=1 Tax=Draconibacterium orientale TaxID=1168034 RepID=UPI002A0A3AF0|nr:hydrolase [Draconibacterium orientale]
MRPPLTIAVDFDGTIVEHRYPKIGNELPFAIETLRALQEKGHKLILWTYRAEKELIEAVEFCRKKGLEFYAVNKNYPEEKLNGNISRKILADLYIDDRNYGGMPNWTDIYHSLHPEERIDAERTEIKSWWRKIESLQRGIR